MKVKRKDLKFNTEYWVCDTAMASGITNNNVFQYNPTFFCKVKNRNIILFDGDYIAFTEESEALDLSNRMIKDPSLMYKL